MNLNVQPLNITLATFQVLGSPRRHCGLASQKVLLNSAAPEAARTLVALAPWFCMEAGSPGLKDGALSASLLAALEAAPTATPTPMHRALDLPHLLGLSKWGRTVFFLRQCRGVIMKPTSVVYWVTLASHLTSLTLCLLINKIELPVPASAWQVCSGA